MRQRNFTKQTPVCRAIALLVLCGGLHLPSQAQPDFAAFKITGVDGYLSAGAQTDAIETTVSDPSTSTASATAQKQKQRDLRFEAALTLHSYVYHPKFVTLDLGVGAITASGLSESNDLTTRTHDPLYNFSARASVLSDKPMHGTVFFEHLNSTPNVSADEIFNQQSRRYGFTTTVTAPLSPVAIEIDAAREHNKGSSVTRLVDDELDRFNLVASRALWDFGTTQMSFRTLRQDSSSGNVNLPIQTSRMDSKTLGVYTRLKLGKEQPFELNNNIEYSTQMFALEQGHTPDLNDLRFSLDYHRRHSEEFTSFANYQFGRNRQDELATYSDSANAGVSWNASKTFDAQAGMHLNDTRATQFSSHAWSADGATRYEKDLPLGTGQVSYSLRYEQRDQTATDAQAAIIGERMVLNGTTSTRLARSRVTGGSVTVRNIGRTQLFVEGIDYQLTVVGTSTRVQRLLSGNILDGEEVLVDYAFDTGGTYGSATVDQSVNFNWALSRVLNVYLRYGDSNPRVTSGEPTSPLNAVQSRVFGARADVPLASSFEIVAGGLLERENHGETIAPYVRTAAEMYLQGGVPFDISANYRLGARRTLVQADIEAQNVDLLAYDLMFGWRLESGLNLTATGLYERDTGGVDVRERKTVSLKAMWRYRKLSLTADLARTIESQGLYVRDRTMGRLGLRRDL